MSRPEHVTCIGDPSSAWQWHGRTCYRRTLCGLPCGGEFVFESLVHAEATVRFGSRLTCCRGCQAIATPPDEPTLPLLAAVAILAVAVILAALALDLILSGRWPQMPQFGTGRVP